MHSQQFPHRVQLQRRPPGGSMGHPSTTWEDVGLPIYANIRYGTGSEAIRAGQVVSQAKASIRVRWRTGITAAMRVTHQGVAYKILVVLPDMERRRHVDLVCEVMGDGKA